MEREVKSPWMIQCRRRAVEGILLSLFSLFRLRRLFDVRRHFISITPSGGDCLTRLAPRPSLSVCFD